MLHGYENKGGGQGKSAGLEGQMWGMGCSEEGGL